MPHYKLTYFNGRGLGEGARMLFHYAEVPFEDVRIEKEQWPDMKASTPYGQLPVLEVDGEEIPQSGAIYRYLGRLFGLVPKDPVAEAQVDGVFDAHKDFAAETKQYFYVAAGFQEGDKDKLYKEAFVPARESYFAKLKKHLEKTGGEHLVGKELTWADIVIAESLASIDEFVPGFLEDAPEIRKFVDHIREIPKIAKWIAERPKTKY